MGTINIYEIYVSCMPAQHVPVVNAGRPCMHLRTRCSTMLAALQDDST